MERAGGDQRCPSPIQNLRVSVCSNKYSKNPHREQVDKGPRRYFESGEGGGGLTSDSKWGEAEYIFSQQLFIIFRKVGTRRGLKPPPPPRARWIKNI